MQVVYEKKVSDFGTITLILVDLPNIGLNENETDSKHRNRTLFLKKDCHLTIKETEVHEMEHHLFSTDTVPYRTRRRVVRRVRLQVYGDTCTRTYTGHMCTRTYTSAHTSFHVHTGTCTCFCFHVSNRIQYGKSSVRR